MALSAVLQQSLTRTETSSSVVNAAGTSSKPLSVVLECSEFYPYHQILWSSEYQSRI